MFIHIHLCSKTHILYASIPIWIYIHTYVCLVCLFMDICTHVFPCMSVYIQIYLHACIHVHTCMYEYIYVCTCIDGCLYTYLNIYIDITCMHRHTYKHTYICRCINVCNMGIYVPTYKHICPCKAVCIYVNICIYIQCIHAIHVIIFVSAEQNANRFSSYLQYPPTHTFFDPWDEECLLSFLDSCDPNFSLTSF